MNLPLRGMNTRKISDPHQERTLQATARKAQLLQDFLHRHGFSDSNSPRGVGGCPHGHAPKVKMEYAMPLHVAAQLGDQEIVQLLLKSGADALATTGGGTALEIAEEMNCDGSHRGVILLLRESLKMHSVCL
ncbi:unnamed protein product [Durusdinium trenchii]|uniref:Uncharacterized protein n=1 Tax=Durusdinium trenchii TaxID=1381693 RepID=A0ABP0HSF5_9DINO